MKSKYLALGLSALLALSMVSCGNQQVQEPQEPKQEETQQAEPVSTPSAVEPMEIKQDVLSTEPGDAEPGEVEGSGTVEGSGSVESDLVEVELFTEVNETVYATGTVNIRASWSAGSEKVGSLSAGDSVTRTGVAIAGTEADGWSRVTLSDGTTAYIASSYLSTTKPATQTTQSQRSQSGKTTTTTSQTQQPQQQEDTSADRGSTELPPNFTMGDPSQISTGTSNPYSGYGEVNIGYGGN